MVRGNRIRNAAFTAVRGNSASNLQITGNTCSSLGEVALYAEFSFEGAVIANNIVDGAAVGVSVTNSNVGGRLGVVQGNLIRNLHSSRPQDATAKRVPAIGIGIEADTVASGNVVENVEGIGIAVGYGPYLRDVAVRIVRGTDIGIARLGGAGRGLSGDRRQSDFRSAARRHCRHGVEEKRHRRPQQRRRRTLCAIVDRRQPRAVTARLLHHCKRSSAVGVRVLIASSLPLLAMTLRLMRSPC